jgi:hypothetical protein
MNHTESSILIVGFGRRVIDDIYPSIRNMYDASQIKIFSNSPRVENINGEIVESLPISELDEKLTQKPIAKLIISIPPNGILDFINQLSTYDLTCTDVYVDTPIKFSGLESLLNVNSVKVLEDFPTSPIGFFLKYLMAKKIFLLVFYKSFYAYHGYSLIRMLSKYDGPEKKIYKVLSNKYLSIYFLGRKFILTIGTRDYDKARVWGLGSSFYSNMNVHIQIFSKDYEFKYNNEIFDSVENKYFRLAKERQQNSLFEDVNGVKRVGLIRILSNHSDLTYRPEFGTSLEEAYSDYTSTRHML